jgi:glucokinase
MKKWIVGIDVGGTKIAVVLATRQGKIISSARLETRHHSKVHQNLQELVATVKKILQQNKVPSRKLLGIGICAPGPVDNLSGKIPHSPNMPGWKGIEIRKILQHHFKTPIVMSNDATAAALAVQYFGEGKKVSNILYITVSTGIGSGIVLNNSLIEGTSFSAGELGHTTLIVNGPLCGCGKRGCLEAISSGTAIAKLALAALKKDYLLMKAFHFQWKTAFSKSRLHLILRKAGQVTSRDVKMVALKGDALANAILIHAGMYLGVGISNAINLLNPQLIALGGGVLIGGEKILKSARQAIRQEAWPPSLRACRIVRTRLANHVNTLGAISLVLHQFNYQSPR